MSGKRFAATIRVEIAYALRDRQSLITVEAEEGGTVKEVIQRSGVLTAFPEIDLKCAKVGIFGRPVSLNTRVRNGDRIEIYRPLIVEPKQVRRERAQRAQRGSRRG